MLTVSVRFDAHYTGWLNFTPPRSEDMPLLILVRCAVAARHLDIATRNHIAPTLYTLTEQVILQSVRIVNE